MQHVLELELARGGGIGRGAIESEPAAAALGVAHGVVGPLHQSVGVVCILRMDRNADASRQEDRLACDPHGL